MTQLTNKQPEFWDKMFAEGRDYTIISDTFLDVIIQTQKITGKVLDVGCGTGDLVMKLAKHGFSVTGVDFSRVAIEKAEDRAKAEGVVATFVVGKITMVEDIFDAIFCKLVYAFVEDKLAFLQDIRSRLNNGGVFVLITPILNETNQAIEKKPGICVTSMDILHLQKLFSAVIEYHVENGEEGRIIKTFVCKK